MKICMQGSCPENTLPWLSSRQLESFLADPAIRDVLVQDRTPFEDFLLLAPQPSHILSSVYAEYL